MPAGVVRGGAGRLWPYHRKGVIQALTNLKRGWLLFFGALFVTVPLRVCELAFFVDYKTGFSDSPAIGTVLLFFLAAVSAIIIFMCLRDKNAPKRYPAMKNIPAGVTAGLVGILTLIHSVLMIVSFAKPPAGMEKAAVPVSQMYVNIILGFVGVIAGAVWLVEALGYFREKNVFRGMPAFALVPPIWLCLNLAAMVINTIYADFIENIYDMLTVMFMLVFVFTRAKLFAGVRLRSTGKRLYAFGLPAVLFACITAAPNVVVQALGLMPVSGLSLTFSLVLTALALYGAVHLWVLQGVPDISLPEEPEPEETAPNPLPNEEIVPPPVQEEAVLEPACPEPYEDGEIIDIPKTPAIYKFKEPKRKKKKEKKGPFLKRMLAFCRKIFRAPPSEEELAQEQPVPWQPSHLDGPADKKLEQDWFLDYYGFERKDGQAYVPKVYDAPPQPDPKPSQDSPPTGDSKEG